MGSDQFNVYDLALKREKEMELKYRLLASEAKTKGLKKIFERMADEEGKHAEIVEHKSKSKGDLGKTLVVDMRNSIKKLKEVDGLTETSLDQIEVYEKIRDLEKEAENFYLRKASEATDKDLVAVLKEFAHEEHKHFVIMQEIVNFLRRPVDWAESAEFSGLDHY